VNKADKARFEKLREIGCITCRPNGYREPAVHHLVEGNRLGPQFTIPLCPWCHQGIAPTGTTYREALSLIGPHFHGQKSAFVSKYGSERSLLALVDDILEAT